MDKKYLVSKVRCSSYDNEEVRGALVKSLKNIGFDLKKGKKILLKPNVLCASRPEDSITTHPVVLEELCKILKAHGCEIIIGDSSGFDTMEAFEVSGILRLSKYATIIDFEKTEKKFFLLKENKEIALPKIIFDVDLIINLPKLKTHLLTEVSLAVKNTFGCVPGKLKERYHKIYPSPDDFSRLIFDIYSLIKPGLNILDGVIGLEGKGPGTGGKSIRSNIIMSSTNAEALDLIAAEFMGFSKEEVYTLIYSKIKKEDIEIIGDMKDINMKFKKPGFLSVKSIKPLVKSLPKPKINFNDNCRQCYRCEKKCPVNAIHLDPFPICNHNKCIRCLCCIEICPHNAISLKESYITRTIKKFKNTLGRK
ncbi:MAG: DUF362 domain-containing protein [Nanoarchaeota archaeon]|nr:DUF362 domain-containing protein [Nanoarchaeota archaeon]